MNLGEEMRLITNLMDNYLPVLIDQQEFEEVLRCSLEQCSMGRETNPDTWRP